MAFIDHVTLEVSDTAAAADLYSGVFGVGSAVRLRASEAPTTGFRGFTLGLDVAESSGVDTLIGAAMAAGATALKPAKKQFWGGYSGVVQAPDGTIVKVATNAKKDVGQTEVTVERVVLLLGVADVAASKRFHVGHGLVVAKSYGSKYVEFTAGSGAVTLGLYKRAGLAKEFGVSPEGTGSHRLAIGSGAGPFTDPDGFAWESAAALEV
jgi:hypothetical protein